MSKDDKTSPNGNVNAERAMIAARMMAAARGEGFLEIPDAEKWFTRNGDKVTLPSGRVVKLKPIDQDRLLSMTMALIPKELLFMSAQSFRIALGAKCVDDPGMLAKIIHFMFTEGVSEPQIVARPQGIPLEPGQIRFQDLDSNDVVPLMAAIGDFLPDWSGGNGVR